jgi:hypothetical protein
MNGVGGTRYTVSFEHNYNHKTRVAKETKNSNITRFVCSKAGLSVCMGSNFMYLKRVGVRRN